MSRVPIEVALPKYAVVVNAIQRRIGDGTYPPGSKIPSETELVEEFDASRPVVVRALNLLQQEGWLDSHQGKGRFVRARPPVTSRSIPGHLPELFAGDDRAGVQVLRVGPMLAPSRAAVALGIDAGTPVIARQRLVVGEPGPVELGTVYVPVELAAGTDLGKAESMTEGLLEHLGRRKGLEFDHATERLSTRPATAEEATLLEINRRDCVLTVLVAVFDRAAAAQLAIDVVIPPSRHELEDVFPLS